VQYCHSRPRSEVLHPRYPQVLAECDKFDLPTLTRLVALADSNNARTCCHAAEQEDIIDETLFYFRANVMFRNFSIESAADRTLIYLTFYTQQCLRELERVDDKQAGKCANESLLLNAML
jgi:hypothetical protein